MKFTDRLAVAAFLILALAQLSAPPPAAAGLCPAPCGR